MRTYSLGGEDLIIEAILKLIGIKSKYCIELGAANGFTHSNTRGFIEEGWDSLLMDKNNERNKDVKREWITAENINELFKKYDVPDIVDFMSIDIDGNDYWVWKAMEIKPRIVCIEYNSSIPVGEKKIIKYNPEFIFDKITNYYGASMSAMIDLGEEKGYKPVYEVDNNNLIFIRENELNDIKFDEFRLSHLFKDGKINWEPIHCYQETNKKFYEY